MNIPEKQSELAKAWIRLMDGCAAIRNELRMCIFSQLVAAYSEPQRHYHNLSHLYSFLCELQDIRELINEPETLELAAWFHDVVYNPRSSENEFRSAEVAVNSLHELGLCDKRIARVSELICMTKTHQSPPADTDAAFFLDADLVVLGWAHRFYVEYAESIRMEYAWVADRDFCSARRLILQRFLERPVIFQSHLFRDKWESQARTNIAAEIAQLEDKLRILPT